MFIMALWVDNTPKKHWPLAEVIEMYESKNGLIRLVRLKLQHTTLVHPTKSLSTKRSLLNLFK